MDNNRKLVETVVTGLPLRKCALDPGQCLPTENAHAVTGYMGTPINRTAAALLGYAGTPFKFL